MFGDGASLSTTLVLFSDVNGRSLEKLATCGSAPLGFCSTVLVTARNGQAVPLGGYGREAGHKDALVAVDAATARQHWRRRSSLAIGDVVRDDATPHALCSRSILKRAVLELDHREISALVGAELEVYFLPQEQTSGSGVTHLDRGARIRQLYGPPGLARIASTIDDVVAAAERLGVGIASAHRERGNLQYEFALQPRDPLTAADEIFLLREVISSSAEEHGLLACFLPLPFSDQSGSGLHLNLSFRCDGNALFYLDGDASPSPFLAKAVASLLAHLPACCAIWNPSVNSYKRLWGIGFREAAAFALDGRRDVLVRVSPGLEESARLELRVPDCLANPYASVALCVQLSVLTDGDADENDLGNAGPQLPMTLSEAVAAMEADSRVVGILGAEFCLAFAQLKREEISYYRREVSDLDYLFNGFV